MTELKPGQRVRVRDHFYEALCAGQSGVVTDVRSNWMVLVKLNSFTGPLIFNPADLEEDGDAIPAPGDPRLVVYVVETRSIATADAGWELQTVYISEDAAERDAKRYASPQQQVRVQSLIVQGTQPGAVHDPRPCQLGTLAG
ncbi:hypothetical protein [Arsenicicoccus dermatophilus]|uniref:hypothetical protein n=1 Tax=Arsenicicoccus dermatophilus TaxID=1076331 RepID=UPI0039170F34